MRRIEHHHLDFKGTPKYVFEFKSLGCTFDSSSTFESDSGRIMWEVDITGYVTAQKVYQ